MPAVRWIAVLVLCAAGLLAGCGRASEGDSRKRAAVEIRHAFDAYRAAVIRADFPAACRTLAPGEVRKTRALVRSLAIGGDESCASALRSLSGLARAQGEGAKILDTLRRSRVVSVAVTGDRATLRYRTPKSSAQAGAQRIAGRWLLTGVTGS